MKYNILVISFLIFIISSSSAIGDNNYIINNNTVYIDDSQVYLSATPHTLSSSGWVYFNLTSKVYTGNIDACWGFNTTASKPTKAMVYSPYWVNTTTNHEKTFYNSTFHIYTGNALDYGNSYNTNYKYTINESVVNDNGTTYIISNAAFDSFDTDGTNYTIYWHNRHDNYYLWKDFSSSFNSVINDYKGYNKWYYIKNIPITSNKEYTVRTWIDVPISTEKQSGKYYFAIKPSTETILQAVNNGHFYNLDPWWNATWNYRKEIILTGGTSGVQNDYQLLLNITYDSDMQSDFDDLRFCNETHKLDAWLKSKADSSYALVWVEFPTTPANMVEQTYYIYYGNSGAGSDWDIRTTFCAGSDMNDLTGFTEIGTGSITDGIYTSEAGTTSPQTYYGLFWNTTFGLEYILGIRTKTDDSYSMIGWYDEIKDEIYIDGTNYADAQLNPDGLSWTLTEKDNVISQVNVVNVGGTGFYTTEIGRESSSQIGYYVNDNLVRNEILQVPTVDLYPKMTGYQSGQIDVDWFYVRKYAANPPTYVFGAEESALYTPANPTLFGNTTGNYWVNHTWVVGTGNVTDSYNVSVNSVWYNTTINTFYNDTYVVHGWQNITVWAYNSTSTGTLSVGSIHQDTQIPNNPITITNTSDWIGNAGEVVYVDYDATDPDTDTPTFSCNRMDLFIDFNTTTGKGNWTATANIYYIDFGVSDGYGSTSNYTMTLRELSIKNGLIAEVKLIMSETTLGLKSINMGNYLVYAFILIGILLIILLIRILNNCIYRG